VGKDQKTPAGRKRDSEEEEGGTKVNSKGPVYPSERTRPRHVTQRNRSERGSPGGPPIPALKERLRGTSNIGEGPCTV